MDQKYRVVGSDAANRCYRVEIVAASNAEEAKKIFLRKWPGGYIDSCRPVGA